MSDTKKLCIECRNSFSVSQMTADRETGWLFCAGCWAMRPAPSQQESSATTAMQPEYKHCSVCLVPWTPKDLTDRGLCPECVSDEAWDARDTADHPNPAPPEAHPCDDGKEEITPKPCRCCGQPAEPDGRWWCACTGTPDCAYCIKTSGKSLTIRQELISLGIFPLVPLTPEERAQDHAEWRARIEQHRTEKKEKQQ